MKTKIFLVLLFLITHFSLLTAQVPQGLNYQAIARDGSGNPVINETLQVKLALMSDSMGSTIYWEELFDEVITNPYGMFTVVMGTGTRQLTSSLPNFTSMNWSATPIFVRTYVCLKGDWKYMGSTRLWSVPYALMANNVGKLPYVNVTGNTTTMDSALFVVRNNNGQIIFAVYNEGVRIYVDDGVAKGATKGGFAIGGFGSAKNPSQEYFRVTRDSTRVYLNSTTLPAAGGFGISSFGGVQENLLTLSSDLLPGGDNASYLGNTTKRWKTLYAVNATINTSDIRLKSNLTEIPYGLESVMQLKPVSFTWKDDPELRIRLGLVAQDVEKVIGEVVDKGNDPAHTLGISYTEIIPVLIKAIQDQQKEIDELKTMVKTLAAGK